MACNVFWKVEGAISIATGSFMRGTFIANNAAFSMAVGDTLEGRAFSTTGAIAIDGTLAYLPKGCGSSSLKGPPAPILGTTADFAIFSSNGLVKNTGITNVTGDVGMNLGVCTGHISSNVNGVIHSNPDSSTSLCSNDLLNLYDYLLN